ncbi:MAG: RIP metalloprotease RseP [Verrucomicrobia bacterium]|nr:MAG: RIP metalloprotease RseP [Verrucomicrobiota bacterium]
MSILSLLYVVGTVLLLFGAAIFVHEYGHFWMARRRGMKVEAFAIGFGPKIFGWTRDGVEYSWRLIPAGGFVKLPQMVTSEALEGKHAAEPLPEITPLTKILVSVAGPFMNVVFAFVIATVIYFTGLPILVNPPIIGFVEPNSTEAKLGILEGDRIVEVDGRPIRGWMEVQEATGLARTNMLPVVIERNGQRNTYNLEAKVNSTFGFKLLNLEPRDHPVVGGVKSGSAAEEAKLQEKDLIIGFAGVPIVNKEQLIKLIRSRGGQVSVIEVKRGDQKLKINITPRQDPTTKDGIIGVALTSDLAELYQVQKPGPLPWDQVSEVISKTIKTFSALYHHEQTGVGAKDLSGPVGIFAMLAKWVNTDYRLALSFLVLLNINLAVINMLPLPVLDGGHITMSLFEAITRRRLSVRFQEYATTIFAVLLISFMVYVTFYDIKRLPLFKAFITQETHIEPSGTSTNR